ncbi:MAG: UvrD-helicase domain-containing protein [bacterium]
MPDSPILQNLNPEQRKAVITTEGPVLVLAGAGSGKTRVLTHRIAYLVQENGITPESILAVTFTNKAAAEMKERTLKLLHTKSYVGEPWVTTFHSFGLRILRREAHHIGYNDDFIIYDTDDQKKLIKMILKELDLSEKIYNLGSILSTISSAKSNFISPVQFDDQADTQFTFHVSKIYPLYQKYLQQNQAMDFDDLIVLTYRLFSQNPEVLAAYQDKFTYFLVDEYQDTNHSQYQLTTMLAQASRNLCVVGDDDQSIYSWRGADVRNILEFESDYPDAVIVKLEQNYRSTKTILNAANQVISFNAQRKRKALWTENSTGELINFYEATHEFDEARFVTEQVQMECKNGKEHQLKDIAILYRTNVQSRALEEAFLRAGIPYQLVGGIKFYERREVKDILAYLRFIVNPFDRISFDRIINLPPRGIGKTALEKFYTFHQSRLNHNFLDTLQNLKEIESELQKAAFNGFTRFFLLIKDLQRKSSEIKITEFFDYLLEATDFIQFVRDGSDEGEERYENVLELRNVISEYSEIESGQALRKFLEDITLFSDADKIKTDRNQVTLITLHAVKGLEFPIVFIVGMEEGLFPHSRSFNSQQELEEERRLCYVGITRARKKLFITRAKERTLYGNQQYTMVSRFIKDIPPDLVHSLNAQLSFTPVFGRKKIEQTSQPNASYQEGEKVTHKTFGKGIIVQVKGDDITVAFEGVGIKRLLASMAPLEKT